MSKIAIIEDDQAIADMYRIKFEAAGFSVTTASNGKTGLEVIEEQKPDMILLDLMMPEMNGDEMLARLRETDWGKDIKVVILTNMGEAEVAENVIKLRVQGFIVKAQYTPTQVVEYVKERLS